MPEIDALRVISGGQTGVDRAALDVAIARDIEHGGWCPRGRLAEDGPLPMRYALQETESSGYRQRTEDLAHAIVDRVLERGRLLQLDTTAPQCARHLGLDDLIALNASSARSYSSSTCRKFRIAVSSGMASRRFSPANARSDAVS